MVVTHHFGIVHFGMVRKLYHLRFGTLLNASHTLIKTPVRKWHTTSLQREMNDIGWNRRVLLSGTQRAGGWLSPFWRRAATAETRIAQG